jgi:protein transport protein SEC61 subunit gamma-like protein
MKIVDTIKNYVRVLRIAKKPSWNEFSDTARICLIGMSVVGIIGFILYMLFIVVPL